MSIYSSNEVSLAYSIDLVVPVMIKVKNQIKRESRDPLKNIVRKKQGPLIARAQAAKQVHCAIRFERPHGRLMLLKKAHQPANSIRYFGVLPDNWDKYP